VANVHSVNDRGQLSKSEQKACHKTKGLMVDSASRFFGRPLDPCANYGS